jgi:hypothetical protein
MSAVTARCGMRARSSACDGCFNRFGENLERPKTAGYRQLSE